METWEIYNRRNYLWIRRAPTSIKAMRLMHFSRLRFLLLSLKHTWCALYLLWQNLDGSSAKLISCHKHCSRSKKEKKKIVTNASRWDRWLAQTNCPAGAQSWVKEETNAEAIGGSCRLLSIHFPLEWEPKWRQPSAFSIACVHVCHYRPEKRRCQRRVKILW